MPRYTLYALETRSGRMDKCARFDAEDELTASEFARKLSRGAYAELWSDQRRIAQFGDKRDSASASHSTEEAAGEVYATADAAWPIIV